MKKKNEKVLLLQKEIDVKDKLIQNLLFLLLENKIEIPENVAKVIKTLYDKDTMFSVIKSDDTKVM